ncbi:UvrD-helicase domain-containing protein [Roseovarius indicus]|uniref:UvrD-helicase domain-containing protein n=1 Tax=Roseovarius indicus TaxID=540747 RepID=UPI0035155C46
MQIELSERQLQFLEAENHTLVTGGAGSGKTTVAIIKAAALSHLLAFKSQKILFLSFARPTIARVEEAIQQSSAITKSEKASIEVDTYHSFFWRLLNSHGYLLGLPRHLEILEGYNEAEILLDLRERYGGKPNPLKSPIEKKRYEKYEAELEKIRWDCAVKNGKIAFDLFAPSVAEMLQRSERIRNLVCLKYPYVILDEFQDTDSDQWDVVVELGKSTTLIALADPEQQIYRWKGADPKRLIQYQRRFSATCVDFEQANFRSAGTDITLFGNDILTQDFSKPLEEYEGIKIIRYGQKNFCNKDMAFKQLNLAIIHSRQRLIESGKPDWSLAVLTGSKETTKRVSELLSNPPSGCAEIRHRPIFDLEAAILGAGVVSALLEQDESATGKERFIRAVLQFLRGRNGDRKPKATYLRDAKKIEQDFASFQKDPRKLSGVSVCSKLLKLHTAFCSNQLSGDPSIDWTTVRGTIENSRDNRLKDAGGATRFLRLLERNVDLKSLLINDWQENGRYANAFRLVDEAFMQEHFALAKKPERGVIVMNIHKSKGKEFDEVIVFDGFYTRFNGKVTQGTYSRICFNNAANDDTKQNLRVAVTRARSKTTILTPKFLPCSLLVASTS